MRFYFDTANLTDNNTMPRLEHAEHLMREGSFQEAKQLLFQIICENPEDLRAICDIGIAFTETGENQKAIKALKHYIKNDTNNPYAWEALGCAQFRIRQIKQARSSLMKALKLMPENASVLRNLGILENNQGNHKESLRQLQHSIKLSPRDYRSLYALNFTFRDLKEKEKRLKILERLLELNPPEKIQYEIKLIQIKISLHWE